MMNQEHEAFGMFLVGAVAEGIGLPFEGKLSDIVSKIQRAVYKGTECGAWVQFDEKGIMVGSIVEGSDAEFSKRIDLSGVDISDEGSTLLNERFWAALDEIDDLACAEWEEANEY